MRRLVLGLVSAAVVLAGCSSTDGSGPQVAPVTPDPSAPQLPVVTVPPTSGPTDRPAAPSPFPSPVVGRPSGGQGAIDTSADARSAFDAWWGYEVQLGSDPRRAEADVYAGGVEVCGQLAGGEPVEVAIKRLEDERGYGEPGAQALLKAAVSALCHEQNAGYRTQFDRDVDFAYQKILTKVTYTPAPFPIYDYGFFAKDVCTFMIQTPNAGPQLYDHLRAATGLRLMENGGVQTDVLNIYVGESVNARCLDLYMQLPPVMQTA